MRCLAVCQTELAIRMLDEILLPGFEIEFIVENRPVARRLHDAGIDVIAGDPRHIDTWVKADLTPGTCVVVEDNGRVGGVGSAIAQALRDAGVTTPVRDYGIPQRFLDHAKRPKILSDVGLTGQSLAREIAGIVAALDTTAAHQIVIDRH